MVKLPKPKLSQSLSSALDLDENLYAKASDEFNWLVDLPSDAYGAIMKVPDQIGVREKLDALGGDTLKLAVVVARRTSAALERVPFGPFFQPVLLGKLFGAKDYVRERTALLAAVPELPAALAKELEGARAVIRDHRAALERAMDVLPDIRALKRLKNKRVRALVLENELQDILQPIDAQYEEVASEKRFASELMIYRVAYALTYCALLQLDPISPHLSKLSPNVVVAYQRIQKRAARLRGLLAALEKAGARVDVLPPVDVHDDTAPVEPADPKAHPVQAIQAAQTTPQPRSAPAVTAPKETPVATRSAQPAWGRAPWENAPELHSAAPPWQEASLGSSAATEPSPPAAPWGASDAPWESQSQVPGEPSDGIKPRKPPWES